MSSAMSNYSEWFLGGVADIINLIRGGKRTVGQLLPLKRAMQMVINGEYFDVRHLGLKELLNSNDALHLQEAWRALYARWGIEYEVPEPWWIYDLIERERREGKTPIYLAPEIAYKNGISVLAKGIGIPAQIPVQGLVGWQMNRYEGWLFVSSSPEPPNCGFSFEEMRKYRGKSGDTTGHFQMTLNMFMVFLGYCRAIQDSSSELKKTCFEVLFGSTYDKDSPVIVEYSDFNTFKVHLGELPEGVMAGARTVTHWVR